MKYGLIVFGDSYNLGDDIQSYAAEQYLPQTDYIIEREQLDAFYTENGERVVVIMAGWFLYNHLNWPPSPFIKPLPISMHFDTYYSKVVGERITKNLVFEDYGATWFIQNGSIGCRDFHTKELIEEFGIPAYFSGCLTLTIKKFKNVEYHGKICLVDIPQRVNHFVRQNTAKDVMEVTHSIKMTSLNWEERRQQVEERLKLYQGASLVVTTRLHAALPCLAIGTPVLLIKEEWSQNRIGTWLEYLNYTTKEMLLEGVYKYDFDTPLDNPKKHISVAEDIEKKCKEFIENCQNDISSKKLNVEMFLDGNKRVQRLKKLLEMRVNEYEEKLKEYQ